MLPCDHDELVPSRRASETQLLTYRVSNHLSAMRKCRVRMLAMMHQCDRRLARARTAPCTGACPLSTHHCCIAQSMTSQAVLRYRHLYHRTSALPDGLLACRPHRRLFCQIDFDRVEPDSRLSVRSICRRLLESQFLSGTVAMGDCSRTCGL